LPVTIATHSEGSPSNQSSTLPMSSSNALCIALSFSASVSLDRPRMRRAWPVERQAQDVLVRLVDEQVVRDLRRPQRHGEREKAG